MEENPTVRGEAFSREALVRAIEESRGNMTEVARRMGVTRQTVYEWVQREGITIERQIVVT